MYKYKIKEITRKKFYNILKKNSLVKFEIRWCASTIDSVEKGHSVGRIGLEKFMWAAISRNNVGNPDLIPSWYIDCFLSRSPHVRLNDNIDCTDSSVHYARRRLPVAISYRISRISSPCFFSFSLYFFFSLFLVRHTSFLS